MSRVAKVTVCVLGALGVAVIAAGVFFLPSQGAITTSASEISVTPAYAADLRSAGFPISVQRAFEAGYTSGWHGDGSAVTAYRYPPGESQAIIEALKRKQPEVVWTETRSGAIDLGPLRDVLPSEFVPSNDSSALLVGLPAKGPPLIEFIVDRTRGIWYSVSNTF